MSELISGKEAKLAWANEKKLQIANTIVGEDFYDLDDSNTALNIFDLDFYKFRLKPRTITITINGIEVPCNKSKHDKDNVVWVINTACENWYDWIHGSDCDFNTLYWETEEEIKQVVSALRSIFKGGV